MQALIWADRFGHELKPLTDKTCPALLPVTGKLIIEYTLEWLVDAGIRQATIMVSPFADQVKQALSDGQRWGMQLDYRLTRGEEEPGYVYQQIQLENPQALLCLRGDMARYFDLAAFLQQAEASSLPVVQASIAGQAAGVCWIQGGKGAPMGVGWPLANDEGPDAPMIDLDGWLNVVDSLPAFHRLNLDAAAGRCPGLQLSGREIALALKQETNPDLLPQGPNEGIVWVGGGSRIDPTVNLQGEVVIGDHVIVDKHAHLRDTVVLPYSYIGESVELQNAIVRGQDLIRVDNGAIVNVVDSFLLANLKDTAIDRQFSTPLQRMVGLFLLGLSTPLWPLALVLALIQQSRPLMIKRSLRGNRMQINALGQSERREFWAWEWNVSAPILRYLPRLLAVVSNDLCLVGALPLTRQQVTEHVAEWEQLAINAPSGLIGPTQLKLSVEAPIEECLMSDAFYAAQSSSINDLRCLLDGFFAIFSLKAWRH